MKILVAGGGIGGLTVAIALAHRGFDVEVFEQQQEPRELGAGIAIFPNAARVIRALGIETTLAPLMHRPVGLHLRGGKSGRLVVESDFSSQEARFSARSYNLHRADLRLTLINAARACPTVRVRMGQRVVSVSSEPDHVAIETDQGVSVIGDALIGADGIHSFVRKTIAGPESPHFSGEVVWRALARRDRLPAGAAVDHLTIWTGTDRHFLHYLVRGGELLNIGGFVESDRWRSESWTEPGSKADFAELFSTFNPVVREIIAATDQCFVQAIHERDPLSSWFKGRTALLGDACHAMPPHMGQGAGMAIEDAIVLARAIADHRQDLGCAFDVYQSRRKDRVARVAAQVRSMGRMYNVGNPIRGAVIHTVAWLMSRVSKTSPADWVWEYDALSD